MIIRPKLLKIVHYSRFLSRDSYHTTQGHTGRHQGQSGGRGRGKNSVRTFIAVSWENQERHGKQV